MSLLTPQDYVVRFASDAGALDQDEEWCELEIDGERRRIRLHDYDELYEIPGLYERVFYEKLQCNSHEVIAELLREELEKADCDPKDIRALDFGAGNGMVAEELDRIGIDEIVGVDLLEEAYEAAYRDRPGLYDDYHVVDMTDPDEGSRRALRSYEFNCMTCVAALGFGDVPTVAFAETFNLVRSPGWIAFNIRERFLEDGDSSGFSRLIDRMMRDGALEERVRVRYPHRRSMAGKPLHYFAIVATKHKDVPMEWAANA